MTPYYLLGLDLGQAADFSALAIAERPGGFVADPTYSVRDLRRWPLHTPYRTIIDDVRATLTANELRRRASLVVDGTGVGRPIVEQFQEAITSAAIVPVLITGGSEQTYENGWWHTPKRNLASVLAVLLQNGRLKVASALAEAETLMKEMSNFRVKITLAGNDTYSAWREGLHDDLVLAVALAAWAGENGMAVNWEDVLHVEIPITDGAPARKPNDAAARLQLRKKVRRGERAEAWRKAGWLP